MGQGHALVRQGRTDEGFRLVDETMVAVTTGELSPIVAGIVYCNTIAFCQDAHDVRRAREWTNALTEWCDRQPDMVAHTGVCLVHRAEVMQLQGAWRAALEEVQQAGERLGQGVLNQRHAGSALYRQGEIQRLQGEFAAAEEAYRAASRLGFEPQPGLALLRLAQGNGAAAAAAIGRVADETEEPLKRAGLLPACVEIMLAVGDLEEARRASGELDAISRDARKRPAESAGRASGRCGDARRRRRPGCSGLAAPRAEHVAGHRSTVRGGAHARPARDGLPPAGRRRRGSARVGGGAHRLRGAGCGPGSDPSGLAADIRSVEERAMD